MSVVNEAIQYGIGVSRVSDDPVPCRYGKLAGNDRRTTAVAVLEDFEEIMPRLFVERFETPIIQDQDLNMAQCALKPGVPAVAASERELGKQPGNTLIQNGTIVSAKLCGQGHMPTSSFRRPRARR